MNDKCLADSRVDLYDIRTFNDHRRLYSGPFNRSTGKKDRVVLGWLDVAIENRKEKKRAKGNERSVVNVSTRQSNDFRLLRKKAVEVG